MSFREKYSQLLSLNKRQNYSKVVVAAEVVAEEKQVEAKNDDASLNTEADKFFIPFGGTKKPAVVPTVYPITSTSTDDVTSTSSASTVNAITGGSITTQGGLGVKKSIHVGGAVKISNSKILNGNDELSLWTNDSNAVVASCYPEGVYPPIGSFNNLIIGTNVPTGIAVGSQNNICIGNASMIDLTTGVRNVCVGSSSGHSINNSNNNTYLGTNSGITNTGSDNVIIGSDMLVGTVFGSNAATSNFVTSVGVNSAIITTPDVAASNSSSLGANVTIEKSNEVVLGDSSVSVLRNNADGVCDLGELNHKYKDCHLSGELNLYGSISGVVGIQAAAATTSYNIVLPSGNSTGFLRNNGAGFISFVDTNSIQIESTTSRSMLSTDQNIIFTSVAGSTVSCTLLTPIVAGTKQLILRNMTIPPNIINVSVSGLLSIIVDTDPAVPVPVFTILPTKWARMVSNGVDRWYVVESNI